MSGAAFPYNDSLTALGMGRLFDPAHADLDGVLRPLVTAHVPPFLGCIQHRTVLKVDEEGAVASAASGAAMETGWPPPLEFVMEVRRPFVCALWERMSEMLLFLGVVWDPAVPG